MDRNFHAGLASAMNQRIQQLATALRSFAVYDLVKGLKPFRYFFFRFDLRSGWKLKYLMNFLCSHYYLCRLGRMKVGCGAMVGAKYKNQVPAFSNSYRCRDNAMASSFLSKPGAFPGAIYG